jgi:hypothetical protein
MTLADTYIIENIEALWPKIDQTYAFDKKANRSMPCGPRDTNAEFSIQFRMDQPTAKALFKAMSAAYQANREDKWAEKLANPFVKDDNGTYTHKATLKGSYNGQTTNKPAQYDSQGNTLPDDFQLTTGSTVNVAVKLVPYDFGGSQSVSLRLNAVQVIKYVPMERSNPFGTVDGGFVAEDPNPFKAKPKTNNVLEMKPATEVDEDDDGFEAEPVKKTAKKAAVNSKTSGDLSDIVDDLFDDED